MKRTNHYTLNMAQLRHRIHIQQVTQALVPNKRDLKTWAKLALVDQDHAVELTLRLVAKEESAQLNQQYRHKTGPTNVLAFPFGLTGVAYLGDVIICAPLVAEEAITQYKQMHHHWAHLVIHGVLHLLGYDHNATADAAIMEARERALLAKLDYPNPYYDN